MNGRREKERERERERETRTDSRIPVLKDERVRDIVRNRGQCNGNVKYTRRNELGGW